MQEFFREPDIPLKDKIVLGPIDKYIKYSKKEALDFFADRFPWKLMIHLFLIALTTAEVLLMLQT